MYSPDAKFEEHRFNISRDILILMKPPMTSLLYLKKPSPVPELSFLPALYKGWTRAGERRVQDNLHAHAQNEPIKNY